MGQFAIAIALILGLFFAGNEAFHRRNDINSEENVVWRGRKLLERQPPAEGDVRFSSCVCPKRSQNPRTTPCPTCVCPTSTATQCPACVCPTTRLSRCVCPTTTTTTRRTSCSELYNDILRLPGCNLVVFVRLSIQMIPVTTSPGTTTQTNGNHEENITPTPTKLFGWRGRKLLEYEPGDDEMLFRCKAVCRNRQRFQNTRTTPCPMCVCPTTPTTTQCPTCSCPATRTKARSPPCVCPAAQRPSCNAHYNGIMRLPGCNVEVFRNQIGSATISPGTTENTSEDSSHEENTTQEDSCDEVCAGNHSCVKLQNSQRKKNLSKLSKECRKCLKSECGDGGNERFRKDCDYNAIIGNCKRDCFYISACAFCYTC